MRNFLLTACGFLFFICTQAQNKPIATDSKVLNQVLANFQADPTNPLKIDQQTLTSIANSIPEGALKTKLLTYSTNLGTDPNLSMRQIYWDLNQTFQKNANLQSLAKYQQTMQGVNLLINNADELFASFKKGNVMPQLSMFINDPVFVQNMNQLTGASYQTMQNLGAGFTIATALLEDVKKRKAFKSDYATYAQLSLQMVYAEIDKALSRSLIDAYVGRDSRNMLSPMYRYDFKSGASILVEKGILKFVHPQKGISKSLIAVENRNDGDYKKIKSYMVMPGFLISPDEKTFFLNTGDMPGWNDCKDCLEKQKGYFVDSETGTVTKILPELNVGSRPQSDEKIVLPKLKYASLNTPQLMNAKFQDGAIYNLDHYQPKNLWLAYSVSPTKHFQYSFSGKGDRTFSVGGIGIEQKSLIYSQLRSVFWEMQDDNFIRLSWGVAYRDEQIWTSSMVHVNKENSTNINRDMMTKELTGLVKSKTGKLYFTSASGKIGVLDLNQARMDDPGFTAKMKASLVDAGLPRYEFDYSENYLFDGIELKTMQWFNVPFLAFSPDEKHLIYTVRNEMFVFNPVSLDIIKKFTFTVVPYNIFFGKENGETTLFTQSFNEFRIPVIKKYSWDKLMTDKIPSYNKETGTNSAPPPPPSKKGSVADDLKQLKALYDQGALSKEEYEKAKKKVLDN